VKYLFCVCLIFSLNSFAQTVRTNDINTEMKDFAYSMFNDTRHLKDPRGLVLFNKTYVVNGRNVVGSPFLYEDWLQGKIVTIDGRVFDGYQIKYNAYHQTLFFKSGKDSLEVNEAVKNFVLLTNYNKEVKLLSFDFFEKIPKLNNPLFLELLYDGEKGKLYKFNKKIVTSLSRDLPNSTENLVFDLKHSYFYFNKKDKKLQALKDDFSNIETLFKPSAQALLSLKTVNMDFKEEANLINYIKLAEQ